jgi:hypothetical protein
MWKGEAEEQEYGGNMNVRMVNDRGFFNLRQRRIFMGNPFVGYYVGIKEAGGEKSAIWFNNFLMGEHDEKTGQITPFNARVIWQMAGVLPMCPVKSVTDVIGLYP